MEFSQGAADLFGFTKTEVVGQNVTTLMPREIADHHGEYLKRYQDNHEARVIGIRRRVTAKYNDGTLFPVALEVAEQETAEHGVSYIGRIRHEELPFKITRGKKSPLNSEK